jgi:hypothetical protein
MKKILLRSFLCAIGFTAITSCSKDVKIPTAQATNKSTAKTPSSSPGTQTQNQDQNNHTCGNHTYPNSSGSHY